MQLIITLTNSFKSYQAYNTFTNTYLLAFLLESFLNNYSTSIFLRFTILQIPFPHKKPFITFLNTTQGDWKCSITHLLSYIAKMCLAALHRVLGRCSRQPVQTSRKYELTFIPKQQPNHCYPTFPPRTLYIAHFT